MKTSVLYTSLNEKSWSKDLTPSLDVRKKYMYVQCIGHYFATSNYCVVNRHNVHSFLLLYTHSGTGIIEYRNKKITLTQGMSFLIDCDLKHSYYAGAEELWDFYWIHFSGTCIEGYMQEIVDACCVTNIDINSIFHEINHYSQENNTIANSILASTAIIEMCTKILLNIKESISNCDHMQSAIIWNSITFIEENMTRKLCLDDICREFSISKFYFSHLFKSQTGMTPNEYLSSIRISKSKSLLRSTDLSVSEIADNSGFNGSSYFIHYFKKQVGMTPLTYRNQFAHDASNLT